jgi:NAD(P)-dependent dehydrogenase (short-subunit alcohol dehydrogenase family)
VPVRCPAATRSTPVGQRVSVHSLDVTDADSVIAFAAAIRDTYGHLDILINNAGAYYDTVQHATNPDFAIVTDAFAVNVLGAWRTTAALLPLITTGGRIVNVSSGAGSFTETGGAAGTPAYAVTKAALNMLTVKLAAELADRQIAVNAVCPGWVATDMGGHGGRPIPEGAAGIVWAATLPDPAPTGRFFRDTHEIPW